MEFPWYNAWCGDIDILGNKKPQSYYRDVVWHRSPIAMAVHQPIPEGKKEAVSYWGWPDEMQSWTWPGIEGKHMQVRVFSRASMVRLYLNGKIIGEQKNEKGITATFDVIYQPGILKAVNVENGKETNAIEFRTAGTPKYIRLTADRKTIQASRNDLSYVMVEVTDDKGQVVPNAEVPIEFSIIGVGEIAAVGNGKPDDMRSFQSNNTKTMNGKCLVIIRPKGKSGVITVKAVSEGLTTAQLIINTK
jgi:beta-galactosidase